MSRSVEIPITNDGVGCVAYYEVAYRVTGAANYTVMEPQVDSPIVINNLADDTEYDYKITRVCCDNTRSGTVIGTFDTTLSP